MENIDVDKFTTLVKAKESIWNYKSTAYANETQRRNDWISVCQGMVPDFEEKTNEEKNDIVLQHQTKWRELCDGFERSIKNNNEKLEQEKLYLYSEQLHFLHDLYDVKTMDAQSNSDNISQHEPQSKTRRRRYDDESSQDTSEDEEQADKIKINKVAENYDESEIEGDKQFLLSLLGEFRKIPDNKRLGAKADILKVIRYYRIISDQNYAYHQVLFNDVSAYLYPKK